MNRKNTQASTPLILSLLILLAAPSALLSEGTEEAKGVKSAQEGKSAQDAEGAQDTEGAQDAEDAQDAENAEVAKDSATLYQEGLEELAAGNLTAAVDLLEAATVGEPDNLLYGTDYRQAVIAAAGKETELYDRCLELFRDLVEQHPDAPNAFLNLAFAHVDKIPVEGSITQVILAHTSLGHFASALELEETWLGLYSRGHAYLFWPPIFGRTQNGIDDLERAIELSKEDEQSHFYYARAWAALGDGYWRLDDLETARSIWTEAQETFADDPDLEARMSRTERAELDIYLEAHYDTTLRVGTDLEEIYGVRILLPDDGETTSE